MACVQTFTNQQLPSAPGAPGCGCDGGGGTTGGGACTSANFFNMPSEADPYSIKGYFPVCTDPPCGDPECEPL